VADRDDRSTPGSPPAGIPPGDWGKIIGVFVGALVLAGLIWVCAPMWMVDDGDHTRVTARGKVVPDREAIAAAEGVIRAPLGVAAGALLAGAAAVTAAIVSGHNARLTRESLDRARESVEQAQESNRLAAQRDDQTATHSVRVLEHEQARADDDRFAKAIEQLGHASASVRLGALHSLHRLALQRPERAETVLDVFCAYLRQPFHHPDHDAVPDAVTEEVPASGAPQRTEGAVESGGAVAAVGAVPDQGSAPPVRRGPAGQEARDARAAEHEVRRTAVGLLSTLLPVASDPSGEEKDRVPQTVNLRGAALDDLRLRGGYISDLVLDGAYFASDLVLDGTCVTEGIRMAGTHVRGDVELTETLDQATAALGEAMVASISMQDQARIEKGLLVNAILGSVYLRDARIVGLVRLESDSSVRAGFDLYGQTHLSNLILLPGARINFGLTVSDKARIDAVEMHARARVEGDLHLRHEGSIGALRMGQAAHVGKFVLKTQPSLAAVQLHEDADVDVTEFERLGVPVRSWG
jgi:gas vesicle protein